jgi:uncharacterized phage-like protein YoqJ
MTEILAGTGHRPDKLPNKETGYIIPNPTYNYVCSEIKRNLLEVKPEKVISGMALGYDQWLAYHAIKLNIPLVAAIPFEGQENRWLDDSKRVYYKLLDRASEIVIVSPGGYSAAKMQIRNEFLVDKCTVLLACFDGSPGGTANCVNYAKKQNKRILTINPKLINQSE